MAIVSTLLATGKASRQACQLLMLALRGSALPVLAVPIAPAAHARIPLALCSQNGQPLLGDLQVALLDVRLTQVSTLTSGPGRPVSCCSRAVERIPAVNIVCCRYRACAIGDIRE